MSFDDPPPFQAHQHVPLPIRLYRQANITRAKPLIPTEIASADTAAGHFALMLIVHKGRPHASLLWWSPDEMKFHQVYYGVGGRPDLWTNGQCLTVIRELCEMMTKEFEIDTR
jgi:hypothetical protein